MKTLLTTFFVAVGVVSGLAQPITDYYRLPAERTDLNRSRVERTLARYGSMYTRERWYVSGEGFVRTDINQLDGTFNGLIGTETTVKTGWGATVGWVSRERWAIEGGYARSPIHSTLAIQNGLAPLVYRYTNDKQGFVLRTKYRLPIGKQSMTRSGLWLGAGLWLVPNSGQPLERVSLIGYRGGYRMYGRDQIDTLRLSSNTRISPHLSGLAEASAEYTFQLGGRTELSLFGRKNWGLGNSIRTDITYRVNGGAVQNATLRGNGNGWTFGIALRFNYAMRYDLRSMPNIYNLRGNGEPRRRTEIRSLN